MTKTIDALVEALEAEKAMRLYGQSPECGKEHWESIRERRRAVYEATDAALAQARAEQAEPVAWVDPETLAKLKPGHALPATLATRRCSRFTTPLYATPPAAPVAKLEPLSDAEISIIRRVTRAQSCDPWADAIAFTRAIEAAHNAKLGGMAEAEAIQLKDERRDKVDQTGNQT